MIQITISGAMLVITQGSTTSSYPKDFVTVITRSSIVLQHQGEIILEVKDYTKVTVPTSISLTDLANKLNALIA